MGIHDDQSKNYKIWCKLKGGISSDIIFETIFEWKKKLYENFQVKVLFGPGPMILYVHYLMSNIRIYVQQ